MTLTEMLTATVDRAADAQALDDGISAITYRDLDERTRAVASHLVARGIEPGDRVAFALPNVVEFADWYFGIVRAGGVAVPLNPRLRAAEVAAQVQHAGAVLVVGFPGIDATLAGAHQAGVPSLEITPSTGPAGYLANTDAHRAFLQREDHDPAVMLYTSGTTADPKAAVLSHHNLVSNSETTKEAFGLLPEDRMLGTLPLFHAFGQTVCLNLIVCTGAFVALQPQFNPREALHLITRHKLTVIAAVPSMFTAMLLTHQRTPEEFDLASVRSGISGGSPLAPESYARIVAGLGIRLVEGYGLSEASPVVCLNQGEENRPGSVGTALPGITLGIIDPETGETLEPDNIGELTVDGPNVMLGYWNDPEGTAAAISPEGVLRTGDLAFLGSDGYVHIIDRSKDLVIVAGENVYPREVEDAILEHPAVLECAVVGISDARHGECVIAAVVLAEGQRATEKEVRDHVRSRLAPFKVPRRVWFPAELPKNSTGKILKRALEIPDDVRAAFR